MTAHQGRETLDHGIREGAAGMQRWIGGLFTLWLMASPAQAGQVSIGFEGPGEGQAPTEMPEDGYRVVTRDMMISSPAKSGNGTDGPNEIESAMNTRGAVAILRVAPFTFVSLDWQTETGAPQVVVEGYLGEQLVARDRFVARGSHDVFTTHMANALTGQVIDRLILYPQRDGSGMGALDRVVLEDAAELPETS
ncbi:MULTISPECIES: hypothetical protein [unclassified Roseovarius]|uniref:hypothetical protein n=1 Tax=unclassified Roseovarius TaxID=2614913 RepID=UPI00058F81AD|nr:MULTISPECIES: hypothetical protein [unclassified Roseovarius]